MEGILVVIGGLGDKPCKELGGKTPLEAANTPNMDWFATQGVLGMHYPIDEESIPEADTSLISIFGNDISKASRGQFEAIGSRIRLERGDLALRTNFATIDSLNSGIIIDRRVGRTLKTSEAQVLAKEINNKVRLPYKFQFIPTNQHRGVLIFRGSYSDNISNTDPAYLIRRGLIKGKKLTFKMTKALDDDEESEYSADMVNQFITQTHHMLEKHPLNIRRKQKNLLPANIILTRGAGSEKPDLKKYSGWASFTYGLLERGISLASGMAVFSLEPEAYSGGDAYKIFYETLRKACKQAIKTIINNNKRFEYFYVHFNETDLAGRDGKPLEKKKMIEEIDRIFFSELRRIAHKEKFSLLVTGDHTTSCEKKNHTADPVPILLCNWSELKEKKFCEKECELGGLGKIKAKQLLEKTGFVK